MRYNAVAPETVSDFRARLARAFRGLRGQGFTARQRVACCTSCACAALAPIVGAVVYTHRQNDEEIANRASVHLGFGVSSGGLQAEVDGLALVAGEIIARTLVEVGLVVEWNRTLEQKIFVAHPDSPDAPPVVPLVLAGGSAPAAVVA